MASTPQDMHLVPVNTHSRRSAPFMAALLYLFLPFFFFFSLFFGCLWGEGGARSCFFRFRRRRIFTADFEGDDGKLKRNEPWHGRMTESRIRDRAWETLQSCQTRSAPKTKHAKEATRKRLQNHPDGLIGSLAVCGKRTGCRKRSREV